MLCASVLCLTAHADLTRPIQWILNVLCIVGLVLPYVVSLLAWFLSVRGVDTLQSVPGMSGAGTTVAILDMMKLGALAFAFPFLLELWHVRAESAAEVRQIAYDCCEEALERHLR